MDDVTTTPTDTPTPLSERLAALKDRMGASPETDSLTSAMTQLDDQQGHLLKLVAGLTEDVQDLAPRLVAELQDLVPEPPKIPDLTGRIESLEQLVRALAEVINENADSHQAALASLKAEPAPAMPDLGPRLEALERAVQTLTDAVHDGADAHSAALTSVTGALDQHAAQQTAVLEQHAAQQSAVLEQHAAQQAEALEHHAEVLERQAAVLDHRAEQQASLVRELHEHIDSAALAAVEAILSSR